MKKAEYKNMSVMEDWYWWHIGRMYIIKELLTHIRPVNAKILNVGCGTGGTIPTLCRFGKLTNVDVSKEALKILARKGYEGLLVDKERLPFTDNTFSIVIALDVLEHIEKDGAALREWLRVLKPGGSLILTVPAYQWLWSGHDDALHHKRRYNRKVLRNVVSNSGFSIKKLGYGVTFSLPLIIGFRVLHKLSGKKMDESTSYVAVPKTVNIFFTWLLKIEAKMQKHINFPAGTSVILIANKADA